MGGDTLPASFGGDVTSGEWMVGMENLKLCCHVTPPWFSPRPQADASCGSHGWQSCGALQHRVPLQLNWLPAAGTEAHQAQVPQDKDLSQVVVPI